MANPTVVIMIDKEGEATVETSNVKGGNCRNLSAPYEQALGIATAEKLKPEFYAVEAEAQQKIKI